MSADRPSRPEPGRARTTGAAGAVVAAAGLIAGLGLVLLAARSQNTVHVTPRTRSAAPTTASLLTQPSMALPSRTTAPMHQGSTPGWVTALVVVLVIALAVPLVIWLGRRVRRLMPRWGRGRRPPSLWIGGLAPDDPLVAEALSEGIDEGLSRLGRGPVREAIIACWIELERSAVRAGVPLLPSETAAELATRLFGLRHVDETALQRLADLYREARFSVHPLDERRRREARVHLEQLHADLTTGAPHV